MILVELGRTSIVCGRFNVSDSPLVQVLMTALRVDRLPEPRRNIAPGAIAQLVVQKGEERVLMDGYWSLLIEPRPDGRPGCRPNPKLKTFNARFDRLTSSPLWKGRYRRQRAIIPADGYHEWVGKQCYQISQVGRELALGGLYETWEFAEGSVASFAVITLGEHPRLAHIHNTIPLMLEPEDFDAWLDPGFTQVEAFQDLIKPALHHELRVVPVSSPVTLEVAGPEEVIEKD